MAKEKITQNMLFSFVFISILGNTLITGIGADAKQDAWIAVGIGSLIGLGLAYFYYKLVSKLQDKNLFEIAEYCLGRPVAIVVSLSYVIYFLYISSRVIRDFTELINTTIFPLTPIEVISLSFTIVIAYVIYLGLEVLGRVSEIFIPYLIVIVIILACLLFASEIQFTNLQPILGDGFSPVLKAVFPEILTYPFGQLIVFTLIFPYVNNFQKSKKVVLWSVAIVGLFLVSGTVILIASIGVDRMVSSYFPLVTLIRRIGVGDFFERIDAIVVFIAMLGSLLKASLFFYASLKGLEYIFRIPYRYFTFPIAMSMTVNSIWIAFNSAELLKEGYTIMPNYLHPPMQFVIPLLLMVIVMWKKRRQNAQKNEVRF